MLSGTSLLVLIAGIIGSQIAPSDSLATLPVALFIVGVAAASIPASLLMKRFSRKPVFLGFALTAMCFALLAAWAVELNSFLVFCIAATGIGASTAAVQQYRFAAMEFVDPEHYPHTASTILLGGIFAAIIGPELTLLGKEMFTTPYLGSFLLLAMVYLLGFGVLLTVKNTGRLYGLNTQSARPLSSLLKQPTLIIAVSAAAIGYGVMSFIMTATPLSMHNHFHHSLADTKWVIQSHVASMYLPSLFSGFLIERLGHYRMMALGILAYVACLIIAYTSQGFIGFWSALVFLGIGWNFLFVSATSLLPRTYEERDKFKVQAFNDFTVFTTQAIAALTSGWLLFQYQWQGMLLVSVIPLFLLVFVLVFLRKH
jgi:MFS family permease